MSVAQRVTELEAQVSALNAKLGVHADFNRHDRLQLDRRLNGLLYLNQDWSEAISPDIVIPPTILARADEVVE